MVCPSLNDSQNSNILLSAQFIPVAGQSQLGSSTERTDYAMWTVSGSADRSQNLSNKSLNQIPYQGAKIAHSEMRSGIQGSAATQNLNESHSNHPDMQKKMDSTLRFSNEVSSHSTSGSFLPGTGNNMYRGMGGSGAHSSNNNSQLSSIGANSDSSGSHNQASSFGAQFNSSVNGRTKVQATTSETNYCSSSNNANNGNSPYSGWQGLSSATSVSSSNGWIIPNNISSRKNHDNSNTSGMKESLDKDCDENMSVDNEMYSDLVGATGGSENMDEKPSAGSGNRGSMSWGVPSRLGLLGGGESSVNPGPNTWSSNQSALNSPVTSTWESSRQMGNSSDSARNNTDMMVDNQSSFSGLIGATGGSEFSDGKKNGSNNYKQDTSSHGMPPPRMGLLGGGENSLNTASSGWAESNPSGGGGSTWVSHARIGAGSSDMSGGSSSGMSMPKSPASSWAQAAGKGLNQSLSNSNGGSNGLNSGVMNVESGTIATTATEVPVAASKGAGEYDQELKEALAKNEGWGAIPVNQETLWDVPLSPTPPEGGSGQMWRTPVNNGTEIWQNNLKMNKGTSVPSTSTVPPWGHTPASNIGGHWGDDDSSNNSWNSGAAPNTVSQNWSESAPSNAAAAAAMWGPTVAPPSSEQTWNTGQPGAAWNESATESSGASVWTPPVAKQRNVGSWSPATTPKKDSQPSGWELPSPPVNRRPATGFDDGTAVWGNPQRQGKVSHWKEMPAAKPIMNSVNNGNPSGMPPMSLGGSMPPSGPGMIRLPSGASVACKSDMNATMWNKSPSMGRNATWQDMPSHDTSNIGTWGEDAMQSYPMKNVPGVSNTAGFNSGWSEQSNSAGYWGAKPKAGNSTWADNQVDTSSWMGPAKQRGEMMQEVPDDMSGNAWPEGSKDSGIGYWSTESPNPSVPVGGWAGRKLKGGKPLTRDLIWASKQFRLLIEMGFKKEDAENALRNSNMNFDEALVELRSLTSVDMGMMDSDGFHGRKVRSANIPDDMSMNENVFDPSFGPGNFHGAGFQSGGNFQNVGSIGAFKPHIKCPVPSNASNLLNAAMSGQNIGSVGNITPALLQKLLQQQQQQQPQQNALQLFYMNMQQCNNQTSRAGQNNNFPTATQLRHLFQQIQVAIHAGHLNPQILNQPLAPQTLQLLFQLLQQIKTLHSLQQQQLIHTQHGLKPVVGGPGNPSGLQLNVQLTQAKQRIVNLQNQIAAQQAVFLKQQAPQQHQGIHASQPSADIFKQNVETVPSLQSDFRDLSLKDIPLQAHQQSRLNQWKLPSYDKDENNLCSQNVVTGNNSSFSNEFIRAPGPLPSKTSSSASSNMPNPGPNLHPLLSQGDSAWSSLTRSQADSGWLESVTSLSGLLDGSASNSGSTPAAPAANMNSSMENKEPSNTPPSSGPSTSSASHTSYANDFVQEFEPGKPWKVTQMKNIEDDPHITPGSITRSPLSVNTIKDSDLIWNSKSSPSTTAGSDTTGTLSSSTWMLTPSNTTVSYSSINAINKPGASKSNWTPMSSDSGTSYDVWGVSSSSKLRGPPPGLSSQGWDRPNLSNYLLLRNLTPQIDGSTLKTLCMQHGPLQLFHLSLNSGAALIRYSTREEATKAQSALKNCVLGNTTLMADIPSYQDYHQYCMMTNQNTNGNIPCPSQLGSSGSSGYQSGSNASSYLFSSSNGGSASSSAKLDSTGWNGNNFNTPSSQLWSFPSTGSALWGSSQPGSDHESSTNTPLSRFLPDDLLGGESM